MKLQTLCLFLVLFGFAAAAYKTTVNPPSMVSGPITSEHYVNHVVLGQTSGVINSTNYISTEGALVPLTGAYEVFLSCPSSSYVGTVLDCNLTIKNEGGISIEPTSTVWVDNNGSGMPDLADPQESISRMTQPNQSMSIPISLNVPSSNPTGLIPVRVIVQYLGSSQPDSTASTSVQFYGCPTGTALCSDGVCKAGCVAGPAVSGGAGGGGAFGGGKAFGGGGGSPVNTGSGNSSGLGMGSTLTTLGVDTCGIMVCNVSLMRQIMSDGGQTIIINELTNTGDAECVLRDVRFTDAFPAGLPPSDVNFSIPYASLNGSEVSFQFPVIQPNGSRTVQYSFAGQADPSLLNEFNASEVSIRNLSGVCPSQPNEPNGAAQAAGYGKIAIIEYPDSIMLGLNKTVSYQVIVKNIGNGTLHSTQLLISGLPPESFTISPKAVDMTAGENQAYGIVFSAGDEPGQYPFTFIVSSVDDNAEASSTLSIAAPAGQAAENDEWLATLISQCLPYISLIIWVVTILLGLAVLIVVAGKIRAKANEVEPGGLAGALKKLQDRLTLSANNAQSTQPPEPPKEKGRIKVLDYPKKINLELGEKVTMQVILKNEGGDTLQGVRLLISGLPSSAYAIKPTSARIDAGKTSLFTIEFNSNKGPKQHWFKFVVSSEDDTKEMPSVLTIVESSDTAKKRGH